MVVEMNVGGEDLRTGISVIVPVYNEEKFLDRFFETLLEQTYKNFEVICIDDGSTDNSLSVLEKYESIDKRVRVYKQSNQYAGKARNKGLKLAKGKYILFLDADDFFDKNMMEKSYARIEETKADICCFGVFDYDNETGNCIRNHNQNNQKYYPNKKVFSPTEIPNSIFSFTSPAPWNKLYRKSFIEKNGLRFQEIHSSNDCYFVMCAFALADSITCLRDCLIYYRINVCTSLQANREKEPLLFLKPLLAIKKKLEDCGIFERYIIGYANFSLAYSMWNIESVSLNEFSLRKIYDYLKEHGVEKLSLDTLEDNNVVAKVYFKEYQNLMQCPFDEFIKMSNIVKIKKNISIIVPVYNVEQYLPTCMDSLVAQTLDNIEIICVNDGSTDASLSILREYERKDGRIKIIDKPNAGYGHTMNVGLKASSGEYIGIVESDDWVEPDMCKKLYEQATANGFPDLIKSDAFFVENDGECKISYAWGKRVPHNQIFKTNEHKSVLMAAPTTWLGIYKSSIFKKYKVEWNNTPGASFQDTSFAVMMIMFAQKAYVIDEPFYHYRIDRPTSSINTSNKGFCIFGEFEYLNNILKDKLEIKEEYWPMIQVARFKRYLWCSELVRDRARFWRKGVRDFIKISLEGYLDKRLFSDEDWMNLNRLIDDYCLVENDKQDENNVYVRHVKKDNGNEKYIFPYHMLKLNASVIIYGAGDLGCEMWQMIKADGLVKPVALINGGDEKNNNIEVKDKEYILHTTFDNIVISYIDKELAYNAKKTLLKLGVKEEKIIWDGGCYVRSVFIRERIYPLLERNII